MFAVPICRFAYHFAVGVDDFDDGDFRNLTRAQKFATALLFELPLLMQIGKGTLETDFCTAFNAKVVCNVSLGGFGVLTYISQQFFARYVST